VVSSCSLGSLVANPLEKKEREGERDRREREKIIYKWEEVLL
jgi:hypothetical protein